MEFPGLGQHCSSQTCKQLDFLPMKCDACSNIFCKDHVQYAKHSCQEGLKRDVQVPVCPLCNQPVPVRRGETPDIRVGEHIDRDCQSDPAQTKRNKLYTKKCGLKGCKEKDMISVSCSQCHKSFCLKHRHSLDHNCQTTQSTAKSISKPGVAAVSRLQQNQSFSKQGTATRNAAPPANKKPTVPAMAGGQRPPPVATMVSAVQGQLSEDEALAMALQNSILEEQQTQQFRGQWRDGTRLAPALHTSQAQPRRSSTSCSVS